MSDNEEQASAEPAQASPEDGDENGGDGTSSNAEEAETVEGQTADEQDELLDRVREVDEELGEAVVERLSRLQDEREQLRERLDERESEIEDLESRLRRKQADFQNYKKRAKKRQEQLQARATEDLVSRLVEVRDNLVRAVESDHDDVDSVREGVEMTLREFDRILEEESVAEINPEPGTSVDPQRHEVMMRVDSDQPEGTVAEVYRAGYEMDGKVLRAAQVTVSEGAGSADVDGDESSEAGEGGSGDAGEAGEE